MKMIKRWRLAWRPAMALLLTFAVCGERSIAGVAAGETFALESGGVTVRKLDSLAYVESEYTKRFKFDSYENPKLKELRERYHLDDVTAPGKDEFEKQVLLMDWTHHRFKKFGQPSTTCRGALDILKAIDQGHTFFCAQYADLFASCAASLGWVDRTLALRRHQGTAKGGSTEHSTTEIWSNQHRKWVMLDPTSNMYLEKDDVPLNGWEIRQEWFYHDGQDLTFVVGKEHKKYKKADLPIFLQRFPNFGDLAINPDELDKYGFIGYIPNTDLMDSGPDYAKMFIVKDKLCEGTKWHVRNNPANPATDPYFPIGQAALTLQPEGKSISIDIKTLTPNFKRYDTRIDSGEWKGSADHLLWRPHLGRNQFQARTVNQFGIVGPISTAEVELSE